MENKIFDILKQIFQDKLIRRHDRITLKGLELDFMIPELRLAIEYDGEQHFDKELYKKLYGEGFEEQLKRDRAKEKLCIKKNIKLIRIKYNEEISKRNIHKKIYFIQ
jgi:very-short-patch-repair endonuclease